MKSRIGNALRNKLVHSPRVGYAYCELWASRLALTRALKGKRTGALDEVIIKFMPEAADDKYAKKKIERKIIVNSICFKISWDEYFLFDFEHLSTSEKKQFVGDVERDIIVQKVSTPETMRLLIDKFTASQLFSEFYKRDVALIRGTGDRDSFEEFVGKHKAIIIKPLQGNKGQGVHRAECDETATDNASLFEDILDSSPCVIEELIEPDRSLEQFHPQSLNTVRYTTFIEDDVVYPLFSFARFGVGDSVVDNAGSAGICAGVQTATGIIETNGVDVFGHEYVTHPDSGLPFKGFQIPRWNELVLLTEKLARVVPQQQYVGWDLTLTDKNGWVMVEGNSGGQMRAHQLLTHKGLRETINRFFR